MLFVGIGCYTYAANCNIEPTSASAVSLAISADNTLGCSTPFTVNYTNNSTGATPNTVYTWTFEGGSPSSFTGTTPPPITYNFTGLFDVTVTAVDAVNMQSDTLILTDYIAVGDDLTIDVNTEQGCTFIPIQFSLDGPTSDVIVTWSFGDGTTSTEVNPSHEYQDPGFYTVSITTALNGCINTYSYPNQIQINQSNDVAIVTTGFSSCALPQTVNVSATDPLVTDVLWTFGNPGSQVTATSLDTFFSITTTGSYPLRLEGRSEDNCPFILYDTLVVAPLEVALDDVEIQGCVPLTTTFEATINQDAPIATYQWSIDGNTFSTATPSYTFNATGDYDVSLTVTTTEGCTASVTENNFVMVGDTQSLDFTFNDAVICPDETVQFNTNIAQNFDQLLYVIEGDSSIANTNTFNYQFDSSGVYTVCLSGIDNGCASTICKEDLITVNLPLARFDYTAVCDGNFTVSFINQSEGADSVSWDFGVEGSTGDVSSAFEPTFVYASPSNYIVTLRAFNFALGCEDVFVDTVELNIPQADFTLPPLSGCSPVLINPINTSEGAKSFQWSAPGGAFISGTTATDESPLILYDDPVGNTTIQLIASNGSGCSDTLTSAVFDVEGVTAQAYTIDSIHGCAPYTLQLFDSSTSLLGNIVSWEWYIKDSLFSTAQNPFITIAERGNVLIGLRAFDDTGCSDFISFFIGARKPYAFFDAPELICPGQLVSLAGQTTGEGASPSYLWDFGDGTQKNTKNAQHTYFTEGQYTICFTATNLMGCDSTFCRDITVVTPEPTFAADSVFTTCPPLDVQFQYIGNVDSSFIEGIHWDFGDGNSTSGTFSPSHTYSDNGSYDVTVTVNPSYGNCAASYTEEDFISVQSPSGSLSYELLNACAPVEVAFYSTSGYDAVHSLDLGNGTVLSGDGFVQADTFVYTYTTAGQYTVNLSVTDVSNCTSVVATDEVDVNFIEVDFSSDRTVNCGPGEFQFFNLTQSSYDDLVLQWNFPGSTSPNSNQENPTPFYAQPGSYDVQLIATGIQCSDTFLVEDYITILPVPEPLPSISATGVCVNETITFTDNTDDPDNLVASGVWQFGDGTSTANSNTTYSYGVAGTYTALFIQNTLSGCFDTVAFEITVGEPVSIDITEENLLLCMGQTWVLETTIIQTVPGATVSWSPSDNLSCTDCAAPTLTAGVEQTYTVTLTGPSGCSNSDSVAVTYLPELPPEVNLPASEIICEGEVIQLTAQGGTTQLDYQWEADPALSCTQCANPLITADTTTSFVVTVTGDNGCRSIDSTLVEVSQRDIEFASPDRTICAGESVQLTTNGFGVEPTWNADPTLNCQFCADPIATPDTTTTYVVVVDDEEGCTIIDTVVVNVLMGDEADAGPDQALCAGQSIVLVADEVVGTTNIDWASDDSNPIIDNGTLTPTVSPLATTTYTLTITADQCTVTDEVTVTVATEGSATIQPAVVCEGDTTQLFVEGVAASYAWSPEEVFVDPNVADPLVVLDVDTEVRVTAFLPGCPSGNDELLIPVENPPLVQVSPIYFYVVDVPSPLVVSGDIPGRYEYEWSPATGLSCTDCANPTVTVTDSSTVLFYRVLVTDTQTGCTASFDTELRPATGCEDLVQLPTGFSPNGDGQNDVLYVRTVKVAEIESFRIFDRWGNQVFEGASLNDGWDGRINGVLPDPSSYVWYVEAICPVTGGREVYSGSVTLIR